MISLPAEIVEPDAAPLPPLPQIDPFSPAQWKTLLAIADAVIPSLRPRSTARASDLSVGDVDYSIRLTSLQNAELINDNGDVARQYLAETPSSISAFKDSLWRFVGWHMPPSQRKDPGTALTLLE